MTTKITVKAPKGTAVRVTAIDHSLKEGEPVTETRESENLEPGQEKTFDATATRSYLVEEFTGDPRLGQAPDPIVGKVEPPLGDGPQ